MKIILTILCALFSLSVFAGAPLDKYRNTIWLLQDEGHEFKVVFDEAGASVSFDDNVMVKSDELKYMLSQDDTGIHGGQNAIGFMVDGELAFGLYEGDDDCLLMPDTEAPEDCLRQIK